MFYTYTKNINIVLFMCKKLSAFFCLYFTVKPEIPYYQLLLVTLLSPLSTVDKINIPHLELPLLVGPEPKF
jgi:hypothetical protein